MPGRRPQPRLRSGRSRSPRRPPPTAPRASGRRRPARPLCRRKPHRCRSRGTFRRSMRCDPAPPRRRLRQQHDHVAAVVLAAEIAAANLVSGERRDLESRAGGSADQRQRTSSAAGLGAPSRKPRTSARRRFAVFPRARVCSGVGAATPARGDRAAWEKIVSAERQSRSGDRRRAHARSGRQRESRRALDRPSAGGTPRSH